MDENGKDSSLEEKCENLMNVVVESRKQFGKICIDYDQKTILLENQMLKLKLKQIQSSKFKTKPSKNVQDLNADEMEDLEVFNKEILHSQLILDKLRHHVMDMQSIVWQMKNDLVGKKLQKQITTKALIAEAKKKHDK